jgi:hypothetical protein
LEIKIINIIFRLKILLLSAGFSSLCFAQHIQVSGKVTDSLQTPLPYANILAILQADDREVKYTCSS